jgi:hypothetical protein
MADDLNLLSEKRLNQVHAGLIVCMEGDYPTARALLEERLQFPSSPILTDVIYMGLFIAACGLNDFPAMQIHYRKLLPTRTYTVSRLGFPLLSAAIMRARRGDRTRAIELLGLYFTYPANLTGWMDNWVYLKQLRTELESELGAEGYHDAWQRRKSLDLQTVVAELLAEFEGCAES